MNGYTEQQMIIQVLDEHYHKYTFEYHEHLELAHNHVQIHENDDVNHN